MKMQLNIGINLPSGNKYQFNANKILRRNVVLLKICYLKYLDNWRKKKEAMKLDCFQIWAMINNYSINICEQDFVWICVQLLWRNTSEYDCCFL